MVLPRIVIDFYPQLSMSSAVRNTSRDSTTHLPIGFFLRGLPQIFEVSAARAAGPRAGESRPPKEGGGLESVRDAAGWGGISTLW